MINYKIIDNLLPEEEFKKLYDYIVFNIQFPLTIDSGVGYGPNNEDYNKELENDFRNWYATHISYINDVPISNSYDVIAPILSPVFNQLKLKSLLKIKTNFYPYTHEIFEHCPHIDYSFPCGAALFSLNTCNGFKRLSDGTKIDSIANRVVLFEGNTLHNSSTTSNAKGRWNINFNYL